MKGIKVVQRLLRGRLNRETNRVLDSYACFVRRPQSELEEKLRQLKPEGEPTILLGATPWQQDLVLTLDRLSAHGLIVGASGSGKSYCALSMLSQMLSASTSNIPSFGTLDAKGELFDKAKSYLHAHLFRLSPEERERVRRRIVVIDFSNDEFITPYNILARKGYLADELMIANRIDTISEQFAGLSALSVRMRMTLKYFFLLMAEFDLPLSCFERLCVDSVLLAALVERSQNLAVRDYFLHRFDGESRSTILSVRQRIDALLISEGVRLSLSASSAPDFTALQDKGFIVLVNTAGRTITRGISELLQGLILSDIKQSVFRRSSSQRFIWFFDEAQNLYKTSANREHMVDLLTMGRSFNSFFVLLTQSLTSAIRDADVLNSVLANVKWIVMLRSTLRDAELIAPAIPATGTCAKPRRNPFEPPAYLSEAEEIRAKLREITRLPDRQAYCWLKAQLPTAVRISPPCVREPHEIAGCRSEQFEEFVRSQPLGQGIAKNEIAREMDQLQTRLRELTSPAIQLVSADGRKDGNRTKAKTLIKALEDEYAKKNQ